MGHQFVESLRGFTHRDDVVGNPHVPSPIFGKADLLVHPRENVVEGVVALLQSNQERISLLQGF